MNQLADSSNSFKSGVKVFSDSPDRPRWLQDRERYNVGRRNILWILQHASSLTRSCGGRVEITLMTLRPHAWDAPGAFGDIRHAIRLAQMYGVNVRQVQLPEAPSAEPGSASVVPIRA